MTVPAAVRPGRRERAKQDKHARIFSAAAALFAEHGFERVTTQQIADRADVGAGTLFRYAATKGELFLMVYNERFAAAVEAGALAARDRTDRTDAVHALVEPVLRWARGLGDSADYQRELLFGPAGERYRDEGLAIVADLQHRIAALLLDGPGRGPDDDPGTVREADRAARSVFAVLNLLLVQPLNDLHPGSDTGAELRAQIAQVVRGYAATTGTPDVR